MYKSLLAEYGIPWVVNRSLYSAKLKMMRAIPTTENLFEKKVNIKRIDIFQVDVSKIEKFLSEIFDRDKNEIIQVADKAEKGIIKAFSSIELNYGNPINWHINPITNIEVDKKKKWYKIPDFDPVIGDIKAVWEASRFTHFFYFVRAYMITKDIKYYKAFSAQIDDWINQNPYSYGANYKCGQEATLRMINALIAYSVFNAYGLITREDETNLKELIEGSYKKVLANFFYAQKCIKNNHTLSEITGLMIGAWCSEDETALRKAYQLMNKEIENQFMKDGGYIQYSFNYQRFALQIMEFVLKISETTGFELSEQSKELIEKSALLMYQLQDEKGDVPNYGTNDGALIFPVTICNYRDFRP
ncbi:MAG TPA: heparinase II/III family protein, partial [Clostridia bacterium]|nr:heparinase II/III family protein [Clostridia bacterium]